MTLDEKAGMMLIDTLNAPVEPDTIASTNAAHFVNDEKMTRFIFRNAVSVAGPPNVTPQQAAEFTNAVQEMAEATRLGIPHCSSQTHEITMSATPARASMNRPGRSPSGRRRLVWRQRGTWR